MGQIKLFRADVAQRQVEPIPIVINLDIVEHVCFGLFVRDKALAVDRFDLEAVVSAFHRCVVVTVALRAYAGDRPVSCQQGTMLTRAVLVRGRCAR